MDVETEISSGFSITTCVKVSLSRCLVLGFRGKMVGIAAPSSIILVRSRVLSLDGPERLISILCAKVLEVGAGRIGLVILRGEDAEEPSG